MLNCFSHVRFFSTLWSIAHQTPLSVGFSRQEYWSGLPFPSLGDLPNPGIEPRSLIPPAVAGRFLPLVPPGKPCNSLPELAAPPGLPFFYSLFSCVLYFLSPAFSALSLLYIFLNHIWLPPVLIPRSFCFFSSLQSTRWRQGNCNFLHTNPVPVSSGTDRFPTINHSRFNLMTFLMSVTISLSL